MTYLPPTNILIGIIFSMILLSAAVNLINQKTYAHIFTTDDTASFIAFVNQLQVESDLVKTNLANNNISMAQKHANKAASLLTLDTITEISERNQKLADGLTTTVNDLQKISSSSEKERQMVNKLVSDINSTSNEAVRLIEQRQGPGTSNFLESGIEFLRGIFGGGSEKSANMIEIDDNSTTQPLAFADLIDSILINYGNAYAVDFDMTNMSIMAMMEGGNSPSMTIDSMSDKRTYALADMTDYQSAQALAARAQEIFNTELKSMAPNNKSAFITNLDNGLREFSDAIQEESSPLDIMMIVHTQIHPNLLEAFNLKLRR
jgi:hypothetical protein